MRSPATDSTTASLLAGATLVAAQAVAVGLGGEVEAVAVPVAWIAAGALAVLGTVSAAVRVPDGRVRTAWLLWSVGSGAWLAGAIVRGLAATGLVEPPLLADALWWLFAALGLAGLILRAPAQTFSLRLFVLDAVPVLLGMTALSWLVFSEVLSATLVVELASGVYLVVYLLLALASFQLMVLEGLHRVPSNMWVLGPGFSLAAGGAVLWPAGGVSAPGVERASGLLWTAGLVLVGVAGLRRARASQGFTRLFPPHRESGARAVPPAVAVVGLVTLLYVTPTRSFGLLVSTFLLVAVLSVGLRFVLLRAELVQSRTELVASEARYRELFENARDCVFLLDLDGALTSLNSATEIAFGRTAESLVGQRLSDLVSPGAGRTAVLSLERGSNTGGETALACELEIPIGDGDRTSLDLSARMIFGQGEPIGWQCIARDVTERRRFVEELRRQAFHDALTGLANRLLFADRVEHALAGRTTGTVAVVFVDLDDFKTVNDSLGHQAGDVLLVAVAERLRACVRPSDTCARLGGDEFAILLESSQEAEAVTVADRVLAALRTSFPVGERELFASASLGIAVRERGESVEELLRNADIAMYHAKTQGGAGFAVFEESMLTAARDRLELATGLR